MPHHGTFVLRGGYLSEASRLKIKAKSTFTERYCLCQGTRYESRFPLIDVRRANRHVAHAEGSPSYGSRCNRTPGHRSVGDVVRQRPAARST
jgi:hypothetical protein